MYYYVLLEEINRLKREVEGRELQRIYIEKYGSGSIININRALKRLRKNNEVNFEKRGRKIVYWSLKFKNTKKTKNK